MNGRGIVLVSDLDIGGAAISCGRLRRGLALSCDLPIEWVAARGRGDREACVLESCPGVTTAVLRWVTRTVGWSHRAARVDQAVVDRAMAKAVRDRLPRVVNLHNIHEAMSVRLLDRLPTGCPIVWTLHDMWPLTGSCSYSYGCEKYLDGCNGECPEGSGNETDRSLGWRRREAFFKANSARMAIVCPSRWLAQCARKRLGGGVRVECIPYSIDTNVFRPLGTPRECRRLLSLPDKPVILAGSQLPGERRKGISVLADAVARMRGRMGDSFSVVVFGNYREALELPADWNLRGTICDEELLNIYYNCADAFVLPSYADNLPNTLLEATAAGVPSVTFAVGGCTDIIRDGQNGLVARPGDPVDLAACMERALAMGTDAWNDMRKKCRSIATKEYALDRQARRYLELFGELQ